MTLFDLLNIRRWGTQNPNVPGSMALDPTWAGGLRGAGLGASTTQKPVLVETDDYLDDFLRASDREYVEQIPTPPFSSPLSPEGALASLPGRAVILGDAGVPQVGGMSVAQSLASLARVDPKVARDLMSNRSFRRGIDHTSLPAQPDTPDHSRVVMHRSPLASSRAGPTRQHFPRPLAASYPYGQTDDYGMIINPAFSSPLSPEGALASNYVAPNVIGADATNVNHGVPNVIGADAADPTYGVVMHRRPLPNSIRGAGMISPRQFTGVDLTTQETEGLPENWRSVTGFDDQGNPIVNDMISRVDTDVRTDIPQPPGVSLDRLSPGEKELMDAAMRRRMLAQQAERNRRLALRRTLPGGSLDSLLPVTAVDVTSTDVAYPTAVGNQPIPGRQRTYLTQRDKDRMRAEEFVGVPTTLPKQIAKQPTSTSTQTTAMNPLKKFMGKFNMSSNALQMAGQMMMAADSPMQAAPAAKVGGGQRSYPGPYVTGPSNLSARAPSGLMSLRTPISDPSIDSSVARDTKRLEELMYG